MSFCYAIAWLFHFKMSPNTATYALQLLSGSILSPIQSSFEISLSEAKLRSAERSTHIAQPLFMKSHVLLSTAAQYPVILFALHHWIGKASADSFHRKKQYI